MRNSRLDKGYTRLFKPLPKALKTCGKGHITRIVIFRLLSLNISCIVPKNVLIQADFRLVRLLNAS